MIFFSILIAKCSALFGFISVIMWHFTAVSCSLCKNIENEDEEEEFHQPGGAHRNGGHCDPYGEC